MTKSRILINASDIAVLEGIHIRTARITLRNLKDSLGRLKITVFDLAKEYNTTAEKIQEMIS